jgi:hypothetical protein
LNRFVRLAVSPEPKYRSRVAVRKDSKEAGRRGSNASYWLRRMSSTSPRDSYLITIFRMVHSPKIRSLHIVPREVPDEVRVQPIALVPKPALRLDFASSPNQYRVDGFGKSLKPQPVKRLSRANPSLRPVLSLALLCDNMQMPQDND